jgi:hypothetical protein
MASQVLSGSSNPSYTNNTGQNVRVVINFMANVTSISWAGVSATASSCTIGRNLASLSFFYDTEASTPSGTATLQSVAVTSSMTGNNLAGNIPTANQPEASGSADFSIALPTELMLASGQTFSATCGAYNIVVIPEAG